jgi:hypothetical protein
MTRGAARRPALKAALPAILRIFSDLLFIGAVESGIFRALRARLAQR